MILILIKKILKKIITRKNSSAADRGNQIWNTLFKSQTEILLVVC